MSTNVIAKKDELIDYFKKTIAILLANIVYYKLTTYEIGRRF